MMLALDGRETPQQLKRQQLARLAAAYEARSQSSPTQAERRAQAPYAASVPVYQAVTSGMIADSAGPLRT